MRPKPDSHLAAHTIKYKPFLFPFPAFALPNRPFSSTYSTYSHRVIPRILNHVQHKAKIPNAHLSLPATGHCSMADMDGRACEMSGRVCSTQAKNVLFATKLHEKRWNVVVWHWCCAKHLNGRSVEHIQYMVMWCRVWVWGRFCSLKVPWQGHTVDLFYLAMYGLGDQMPHLAVFLCATENGRTVSIYTGSAQSVLPTT